MWFPNLLKEDFIKVLKTPIIRMNAKTKNLNDKFPLGFVPDNFSVF